MNIRLLRLALLGWFAIGLGFTPQPGWGQENDLIITRLGLSQVRGTSLLTIMLNRSAQPKVYPVSDRRSPQLLIDFPQARTLDLPPNQPGDHHLVQQVRLVALPGGQGVRIIMDISPGQPYVYWRLSRAGTSGGYMYLVGLKPDLQSGGSPPGLALEKRSYAGSPPPPAADASRRPAASALSSENRTLAAGGATSTATSEYQQPSSNSMLEIAQLLPQAGPVLALLEQKGWQVQENTTARGGAKESRKFALSSTQYPDLSVIIEYIPGHPEVSPDIGVLALSTNNYTSSEAQKYKEMKRWDMPTIKKHFEDIGDYYDDGLKPLRLILREQTKATVLRNYEFYRQYLQTAVPQQSNLPETILKHTQEKVNKRLEGVQYTESENPLVIYDQVDFYTIRIYYVGK